MISVKVRSCATCARIWETPADSDDRAAQCPECGAMCEGPHFGVNGVYDVISRQNCLWDPDTGRNEPIDTEADAFIFLQRREDGMCFHWEYEPAFRMWRAFPASRNWAHVSDVEVKL